MEALLKKAEVVEGMFDLQTRDPMIVFGGVDANWQKQRSRHAVERLKGSFEIAWELGH